MKIGQMAEEVNLNTVIMYVLCSSPVLLFAP